MCVYAWRLGNENVPCSHKESPVTARNTNPPSSVRVLFIVQFAEGTGRYA
jgi:hypothetical protein